MMQRAKWYNIHSWVGLKLSILLCFVLVTGTLAVLAHEIDWLANPAMRVNNTQYKPVNWDTVYASARRQFPDARLSSLKAPIDPWFAVEAIYILPDKQRVRGYFHPQSGQYQGQGRWYNWHRFFRMAHRHLMMPLNIGVTLVCLSGLLLLISMISGMVIYKNFWKGWLRWPRTHNPKVFWGDLHRLAGVWSLWLIALICVTGIWYLAEQWGARASYPANGKSSHGQLLLPDADSFSQMQKTLAIDFPSMSVSNIRFPSEYNSGVLFEGQADTLLVRDRANNMVFDPLTTQVLSVRLGEELSLHARISEAADPLHFGTFGGIASKLIYFIFGVIICALAIMGTYLYGLRVTRQRRDQRRQPVWPNALRGMAYWKWPATGLIILCMGLTTYLFTL
jgi:uncharacterized iron-regulated membrane protein